MEPQRDHANAAETHVEPARASGDQESAPKLIFTVPDDSVSAQLFTREEPRAVFNEERLQTRDARPPQVNQRSVSETARAGHAATVRFPITASILAGAAAMVLVIPALRLVVPGNPSSETRGAQPVEQSRPEIEGRPSAAEQPRPRHIEVRSSTVQVATPTVPRLSRPISMNPLPEEVQRDSGDTKSVSARKTDTPPVADTARPVLTAVGGAAAEPRRSALAPVPVIMPIPDRVQHAEPTASTTPPESNIRAGSSDSRELMTSADGARDRPLDGTRDRFPDAALGGTASAPPATTAPATPVGTAGPAEPDERQNIRAVLSKYESAYSELDADAVARVYPKLDKKALGRAFATLDSQQIRLSDCRILLGGPTARAICIGSVMWTPKVGGGLHEQPPREWQFDLRRLDGNWRIGNVSVR